MVAPMTPAAPTRPALRLIAPETVSSLPAVKEMVEGKEEAIDDETEAMVLTEAEAVIITEEEELAAEEDWGMAAVRAEAVVAAVEVVLDLTPGA